MLDHAIENKNAYNKIAKDYSTQYGNLDSSQAIINKFIAMLGDSPKVIELGCGDGTFLAYLHKHKPLAQTLGLDFSSELLKIAKQKSPNSQFIEMDIRELGKVEGKFDAAVSMFVLIHLKTDEIKQVLSDLKKLLNDDAPVLLAFILGKGEQFGPEVMDPSVNTYFNYFSEQQLDELFAELNYNVKAKEIIHYKDAYEDHDEAYYILS